jgi:hypothetical protein
MFDEPIPETEENSVLRFFLEHPRDYDWVFQRRSLHSFWDEHSAAIIAEWVIDRPGTRPSLFWLFDAPEPRCAFESEAAFLDRFQLLLPGEKRRIASSDFEP